MKAKKEKISFLELVWLFVIGCFIGFVLETIFHFLKNGEWINKQGLLYGPFKPIYGFGLIFIILIMNNFREKKFWQKFLIGVILGSAFEYFGSVFQEYVFGTSTWNYSHFNLNVGGRIYLPYCLAWGFISVFCVDILYPWFQKVIANINKNIYRITTCIIAIFMIINVSLTALASIRYSDRANNDNAINTVFKVIDKWYPDEYMQIKFPKMKVIKEKN